MAWPQRVLKNSRGCFHTTQNINFDRDFFLIMEQLRGEIFDHFQGKLKELKENSDLENKEETLIFITNQIDPEIQKVLLEQTVDRRQVLELAINTELGMQYQHQIQQNNKTLIPAGVNAVQYPTKSHRIGHSRITSTNKAVVHRSIVQLLVKTGFQTMAISASLGTKHVKTAAC